MKYGETIACGDGLRSGSLRGRERLGEKTGAIGDAGDDAILGDVVRRLRMKALAGGGLVDPVLRGVGDELAGEALFGSAGPLLLKKRNDLTAHLCERLDVGRVLRFNLKNVIAELRLDDVRGLAGREREGGLIELGNGAAAIEEAEFPALRLAARVVGVLRGEIGEVAAGLDLLEQIVRLGLGGGVGLGIGSGGNGDKDMTNLDLLLDGVLRLVRVVVGLHLGVRDLWLPTGQVRRVERNVLNLARLRDSGRVASFVLIEEGVELCVGGIDLLANVLRRDNNVVELHLDVLLERGLAHRVVRDVDPAGEHGLQAVQLHVALYLRLEAGARGAEGALHEVDVGVVADVGAVGKEVLREGTGAELAAKVFIADLKVETIGLMLEDLALHEDLTGALLHVGHQHIGKVLLLKLALRELGDLGLLDGGSAFKSTGPAGIVNGRKDISVAGVARGIKDARDQGDDHGSDSGDDDEGEDELYGTAVLLQETNHS